MKKTILAAFAVVIYSLASAGISAPKLLKNSSNSKFSVVADGFSHDDHAAMSRGKTLSFNYTPAYEPYSAIGFNNAVAGSKYAAAFKMTNNVATLYAGNDISAITFYTGINKSSRLNDITQARVFITEDLQKPPVYSQDYTITTTDPYTFTTVSLNQPYKIEANKPVYVGVEFVLAKSDDLPIIVDNADHDSDDCGGWVGYYDNGKFTWDNISSYYGFACVGCKITGDNLPQNRMELYQMVCDPVVSQNTAFPLYAVVHNTGANEAKSIEVTYTVGDNSPKTETFTFSEPLAYNKFYTLEVPNLSYGKASPDVINVSFTISKVNGINNEESARSANASITVLPEGKGYQRNVVIEEMTGSWCGYCPRGIVTMENIRKNYTDGSIIPVAVHVNTSGATDPMYASSFSQIANYVSGIPGAVLNRQVEVYPWPYSDVVEACEELRAMPALGKVDLRVKKAPDNDRELVLSASTEFVFSLSDAAERYILAFAITEDDVGPYNQTNYYSGGADGDADGWEKLPRTVSTVYNDVARQLNTFRGITGSIPANVEAGVAYNFNYDLTLVSKVSNPENINVVAYLINRTTGAVENACIVKSNDIQDAIENIITDNQAPVEYFNVQGMPVKDPSNGIYIRRQGSSLSKVIINR